MRSQTSPVRRIFFNEEPRLRAGWRVLGFFLIYLMIQFGALTFATSALGFLFEPAGEADNTRVVVLQALDFVIVMLAVFLARGLLDKRRFETLGVRPRPPWLLDFGVGSAIGLLLMALIFVIHLAAGWIVVERFGWEGPAGGAFLLSLVAFLVAFVLVGFKEELLVRGYLLQNVEDGLGTIWAVVLTSLLFGALHLANPDASLIAAAGIAVAGVLFAVCYLVTRSLWLPIGLHFAWNFAEGPIFGFPVSGIPADVVVVQRIVGPPAMTGGDFGPEAGIVVLIATLLGIGLVTLYGRWRAERYPAPPSDLGK